MFEIKELTDPVHQVLSGDLADRFLSGSPFVISALGNIKILAHFHHRKLRAVFIDEVVFHFGASLKMANAFFVYPDPSQYL